MLAFLTSLRHPMTASNYKHVEKLFEYTAHSVLNQSERDICLIVVCNQAPEYLQDDPRVIYLPVDWPPAKRTEGQKRKYSHFDKDKGLKLSLAATQALKRNASHFFIVDADDWIDRKVADHILTNSKTDCHVVDRGYFVNFARSEFKRRRGLINFCGSTYGGRLDRFAEAIPQITEFDLDVSWEEINDAFESGFLEYALGSHNIPRMMALNDATLKTIPFFATAWVMNNGENALGSDDGPRGIPINSDFCNQFGLPESEFATTPSTPFAAKIFESVTYLRSAIDWRRVKHTKASRY